MTVLALLLAAVAGERSSAVEPWPRLRGAEGAGQGAGYRLPASWAESEWAWSVDLAGTGNASPVVWGDRVFVASARDDDHSKVVSCHATADGRTLWSQSFPGSAETLHGHNSRSTSSPVVDAERVYWMRYADPFVFVEAIDHDGRRLWTHELGSFAAEHGFGASPAVWRDVVIVPHEHDGVPHDHDGVPHDHDGVPHDRDGVAGTHDGRSAIVGLDARTGVRRWRVDRDSAKASYSTPLVLEGDPPLVVVASMAHGFTGIDPRNGTVLWERKCFPKRTVSSPVRVAAAAGELLLGTCGEGGGDNTLVALRLPVTTRDGPEPSIAWQVDRSASPYVPMPLSAAAGIVLWGDRGVVTCVDPADGSTRWKGRVGGNFSASPILVGTAVLNVSADGEIVGIADASNFEVIGRRPLGEPSRATPAVADGRIFFRGERTLRALAVTRPSGAAPTGTSR